MSNAERSIYVADGKNEIHDGIEHAPGGGQALLDPTDTLFLLLDHQSGLFQNVKDITVEARRVASYAVDTVLNVMETGPASERLRAAAYLLDRAFGRPLQTSATMNASAEGRSPVCMGFLH